MANSTICVVTAPNMRFVNTGMTTVDLAAHAFFGRVTENAEVRFYSIVHPNPPGDRRWMMMDLGGPHRSSHGIAEFFEHRPIFGNCEEVFGGDLIVYWGDFLQARHYVEHEAAERLSGVHQLPPNEAVSFAYEALLQSDSAAAVRQKTLIFGSSLLYNRVGDYVAGPYSETLQKLVQGAKLSNFRDPISALRMNHLTGDYETNFLGVDPAFLLHDEDIIQLPAGAWSADLRRRESIGLFFGTRTKLPEFVFPFCDEMASSFGCSPEWTPWFPFHEILRKRSTRSWSLFSRSGRSALLDRIERLLPRGEDYTQGDLLRALGKYRFVITDTYHMAINAWRAGTPAICFGAENNLGNQVIKDFKKRVLYEMFDAGDYYFDASELSSQQRQQATAKRMVRLLRDESQANAVRARMSSHANAVRQRLGHAAREVLA